jgi:hypothetical protein
MSVVFASTGSLASHILARVSFCVDGLCRADLDTVNTQSSSLFVISVVELSRRRSTFCRMPRIVLVLAFAFVGVARGGDVEPYHAIDC